jgi:chromosome segregation ATPase
MNASASPIYHDPSEDRAIHPGAPDALAAPPGHRAPRTWGESITTDLARARRNVRLLGKQREKLQAESADLRAQLAAARSVISEDDEQGGPAIRRALEREAARLGIHGAKARAVLGAVLAELANHATREAKTRILSDQLHNSLALHGLGEVSADATLKTIAGALAWHDQEFAKLNASRKTISEAIARQREELPCG